MSSGATTHKELDNPLVFRPEFGRELTEEEVFGFYPAHGLSATAKLLHVEYGRLKSFIAERGKIATYKNKVKHIYFEDFFPEGRKFKRIYLDSYGDGTLRKLSNEFDMSVSLVGRVRDKFKLPLLHKEDHPGRKKFYKRVKKMYFKGLSTLRIAKITHFSSQRINQILRQQNVELGPQHVTNALYFKTRSKISPSMLIKEIKRLYLDKQLTIAKVAKKLRIDQGTVSNKLKAMGIEIRLNNHRAVKSKRLCFWCGKPLEYVWIRNGPKAQKFHKGKCKNEIKDIKRCDNFRIGRFIRLSKEFRKIWKDRAERQLINLGVKISIRRKIQGAWRNG